METAGASVGQTTSDPTGAVAAKTTQQLVRKRNCTTNERVGNRSLSIGCPFRGGFAAARCHSHPEGDAVTEVVSSINLAAIRKGPAMVAEQAPLAPIAPGGR